MKARYSSEQHEFDLFEEPNGSLVISVLCGTVGLYEVRVRLNEDEIGRYQAEGVESLDDLATRIRKDESKFKSRMI
jgi:hypothetical protein